MFDVEIKRVDIVRNAFRVKDNIAMLIDYFHAASLLFQCMHSSTDQNVT